MLKKTTAFSLCLFFVLFLSPVRSGTAAEIKIGTISLQKIMSNSAAAVEAQKTLKSKAAEFTAKLDKVGQELEGMRDEIKKKESVWSSEVKAEKEREYQKKLRNYQSKQEDAQFELDQLKNKVMGPILQDLQDSIDAVCLANGYTIVLENSRKGIQSQIGLMYAAESLDISDLVQKELDKRTSAKK